MNSIIEGIILKIASKLGLELQKKKDTKIKYSDKGINPTAIGANVVTNIAVDDSDIQIVGDSARAQALQELLNYYVDNILAVAAEVSLGTGDCLIRPFTDGDDIGFNIIGSDDFLITASIGYRLKGVIIKLDEYETRTAVYRLFESQSLRSEGDKEIVVINRFAYKGSDETDISKTIWKDISTEEYIVADQLLLGRYKCPTINRDNYNSANGVPITFGCDGIGSPAYTDEQLAEMKKTSAAKYDGTQKARAMETRLRTLKEQKNALLESGDELGAKQVQKKITAQQKVYREFCKQKSIHRDYVRENVPKSEEIKLTDDQQSAINSYISSDGYMLNYKLRNDIPLTEAEEQFRINLDSALSKMPKYKGNLTRSVYFDDDADLQDFLNAHTVGSTIKYKGYTSTTYGERYNDTSKVEMLIMNAKKGRDISFFNPNEKEVLYGRNSEFYIEKASKSSNGTYYIILREI